MLHKLMAYKDEYEVARLFTNGEFRQTLRDRFEGDFTLKFHLAPPLLAKRDPRTGIARKMTFGPGMEKLFRVLDRGQKSEEDTSALQSLMRITYAVFCLKTNITHHTK